MKNYDGPIDPQKTALLVVDLQNHEISEEEQRKYPEYVDRVKHQIVPNVQRLLQAARSCGVEVMYTVIESLTKDGRDRSLCHRKLVIPKGSWGAQVIPEIAPGEDDIVLPKTASGVFSSTILERVLRNMGIEEVIVVGVLTDQCIDMALRDGVDRSFHMICVTDCCAAYTEERHNYSLRMQYGAVRKVTTEEIVSELSGKLFARNS
ncbi:MULTISPECIES: isochorismatase family cysteine hydrolase [Bradyrhizobium]|uniref:Cysteine hydrolase n=3 Tax=Bradyrhizobium TaxID=374 RepID=A0AAE6CD06_9BRAD|nr:MULTISPECIES: isochorismatase family cysteine hydrolase [Bradyrhizobium]MCG2632952.1 cysteine hydrolase [Bradyrhizobium zhengyangense]MCG2645682.1 cysteine hydrolase [Bradyrhizobium zhengyangense]MCG2673154.1 cysteine hydrolase [Bradyrhizobium zhengyangense]MDN4988241.1 isochorismatase family cysteine hydrolase [Bradyrhizobium sp. WYCCWR 13022]MDN5006305.1 isochorismatase family cysteine hydrolase [Bradyrhizobium sp. WYCCWR 12677]